MKLLTFKNAKSTNQTNQGFTLIELLLYISIAAVILLLTSLFLAELLQSRVKNQTLTEVEQQGLHVMQIITQTGRNAGDTNFVDSFDLSDGVITEDGIALTNSLVFASDLTFQNLSRIDTPGTVRIQFTLSHINPENRNEYDYQKTFIGSATLRHP
ncbi:MAG TPA: prepilin-type N-terminal cleavage/methylation domain-containing protein [Candidatus Paceibacterota bacterium]|nr:prepilin-type N-terminal cleavage/methylation domain-containing protein [Candidatus Paceibacterota bacterium]